MSSSQNASPEKPKTKEKNRKYMNITVHFLDGTCHVFHMQAKCCGYVLFEKVCKFMNLLEVDYFGLEYEDEKNAKCWLEVLKPLCCQLIESCPTLYFQVKFYTPDPVQLEDEFTRYLFALQIKRDLATGVLQCNDNTAALMVSYIIQADFGDHTTEKCGDGTYLSGYKFVPYQDSDIERKIVESHKKHIGQTPAEADLNLLETARRCELYGIKMTPAKDHEGVPLNLAVAHLGILVFQNYTKINTFSWAKIRKLSFKRKKFLIKLHPEGYGYYKDTVEFFFEGRNECKNFWKKCIENHTFFRCSDAKQGMRQRPKIFTRGSSFRYSGRTQKQVSEFVRESCLKRAPFQRSTSLRTPTSPTKRFDEPISPPQPLLPVTSLSCGSISEMAKEPAAPKKTFSISEPTTPHIAQDATRCPKDSTDLQSPSQGLVSPNFSLTQDGFTSPDFLGQDTDDNLSHDSYHIAEETLKSSTECLDDEPAAMQAEDGKTGFAISQKTETDSPASHTNGPKENGSIKLSTSMNGTEKIESSKPTRAPVTPNKEKTEKNINDAEQTVINGYQNSIKIQVCIEPLPNDKKLETRCTDSFNGLSGEDSLENKSNLKLDAEDSTSNSTAENSSVFSESQNSFGSSTFYVESPTFAEKRFYKKAPTDKCYSLAKELLMTERTYRKDLEIINVVFREEFNNQGDMPHDAVDLMLSSIDPLYEVHCSLLRDLEQRLAFWEGKKMKTIQTGIKGVGDIFLGHKDVVQVHTQYVEKLPKVLTRLTNDLAISQRLTAFYEQFESHKICYMPITSFLLRPLFRLHYYSSLLQSLLSCYNESHEDYKNCTAALPDLKSFSENFLPRIESVLNFVKLLELRRTLIGIPECLLNDGKFVREGCLLKFTRSGSQQHMFFLFSDTVLYATRVSGSQLQFKIHGQLSTRNLHVEEAESTHGVDNCFSVSTADKRLVVAAYSERERARWLYDLRRVLRDAKRRQDIPANDASDQVRVSLDDKCESSDDAEDFVLSREEKPATHHVNTSIHVCWHRNISIGQQDLLLSVKHCLSGYVMRKFKNNSGWQKLWVVLANLCLFFYKSYLDESPLASLPLAGYRITPASNKDPISGECIFKLQYKNHEYFFMVENQHTFDRWMEAVSLCTLTEDETTRL